MDINKINWKKWIIINIIGIIIVISIILNILYIPQYFKIYKSETSSHFITIQVYSNNGTKNNDDDYPQNSFQMSKQFTFLNQYLLKINETNPGFFSLSINNRFISSIKGIPDTTKKFWDISSRTNSSCKTQKNDSCNYGIDKLTPQIGDIFMIKYLKIWNT